MTRQDRELRRALKKLTRSMREKGLLDVYAALLAFIKELMSVRNNTVPDIPDIPLEDIDRGSKKRALLIGSNFPGTGDSELKGCLNDLANMKVLLTRNGFSNIKIISDLSNMKPNRATIIKELPKFLKSVKQNETLVIHFSGHGKQCRAFNKLEEKDAFDECICTLETKGRISIISDNELNTIVRNNLHKTSTLYMITDCCHSGSICDLKYTYNPTTMKWDESSEIKDAVNCGNVVLLSGCRDEETSADAQFRIGGKLVNEGALTRALLEALKKETELGKVYNEIHKFLKEFWFEQYPLLSTNNPKINLSSTFWSELGK